MNGEVIFLKDRIIKINKDVLQNMKNKALRNFSGKIRYCVHDKEDAGMQEMLFVIPREGYARPHMHEDVAESHVIVEGEGYCILFDDTGDILDSFKVSPEYNFIYRISKQIWHMVIPISKQMVIYEVREGKFTDGTNIFPEWAPEEKEKEKIKKYRADLLKQIGGVI